MARPHISICLALTVMMGCSSQQGGKSPTPAGGVQIEDDTTVVGNTVWKTAPDGLAMGISHLGDLALNVHFENQGASDIKGLIRSPARFILELNGKYYAMADYGGKSSFMPPGRAYGPLRMDLTKFWEIPKLTLHYTVEPNDSHPVLEKGRNTVRLHYKIKDKLIPSGKLTVEQ